MKPEESRTPIKHKHELEHAAPTVIHDPEQDMYVLERWLRHAMENQVRFWTVVVAGVVLLVSLSLLASGLSVGRAGTNEAWSKLEAAKTAEEREEIAAAYPKTPAEQSALLMVASEYYMRGFADLPTNKDVALPLLKKALDRFQKVADEAPADSVQARAAALGVARTLEARNEIEKAVAQYDKVAGNAAWKGTPEAELAARYAARLKQPEAAAFYKELYAYKPPEATLPPGGSAPLGTTSTGSNPLTIPALTPPAGSIPGLGGSGTPIKLPDPLVVPPPPPTPTPAPAPKAEMPAAKTVDLTPAPAPKPKAEANAPATTVPALPAEPFAPKAATPAPKAETPAPKAPAPKAETPAPKAEPAGGLPADPFDPGKK